MEKFCTQTITIVIFSLAMSACGKRPQIVTGIQVQSSVVASDVMLTLKADLDLGNLSFPAVTLPILHPRGQTPIGSVDLLPVLGGKNMMKINLNVSSLVDIQAQEVRLPNGNLIPLLANTPSIEVPLGSGAKLYLTMAANVVAVGVAVPIKTFDGIGSAVGAVNLFPVFTIDKARGAAGIFTSSQAGKNGFALVVDVSEYVKMQDIFVPSSKMETAALSFSSQIPVRAKEDKINSMILNLNQRGKRLELHR